MFLSRAFVAPSCFGEEDLVQHFTLPSLSFFFFFHSGESMRGCVRAIAFGRSNCGVSTLTPCDVCSVTLLWWGQLVLHSVCVSYDKKKINNKKKSCCNISESTSYRTLCSRLCITYMSRGCFKNVFRLQIKIRDKIQFAHTHTSIIIWINMRVFVWNNPLISFTCLFALLAIQQDAFVEREKLFLFE